MSITKKHLNKSARIAGPGFKIDFFLIFAGIIDSSSNKQREFSPEKPLSEWRSTDNEVQASPCISFFNGIDYVPLA